MIEIIIALGLIGNAIICLLMVWRGWIARLPWFFLTTASAVLIEVACYWLNYTDRQMYDTLRIFVEYWLYLFLFAMCGWEAHTVRVNWLEKLMLIQVAISVVALVAHLGGYSWTVYRVEIFNCWVNVAGILYSIFRFKGECTYEPR